MSASRPLRLTLLASEWKSSKGGLSTMNRELAKQLAKLPNVSVSFFVPKCSDEDKRAANDHNVTILEAKELPCYEPADWLAFPPKGHDIDFVIGHGVKLGKQAPIIKGLHNCKWMQVVHTAPDELAMYKAYDDAISKGDEKQWNELKLCQMADLVVAVGPKLMEFYSAYLMSSGKEVYNLTPSIFTELASLKISAQSSKKFRILVFGRGDAEDFKLKGFDIAAQAVAKLNDRSYLLTFVGAPGGSETDVANKLLQQGLSESQLIVKGYLENREYLTTLLCASNVAIVPSRTEGFGLTALEALSAGLPFLVSQNSGFGEALQEISPECPFVIDSEEPDRWAEAIKDVRQKGSERAIRECQELRTRYAENYSWEKQCKDLVQMMLILIRDQPPSDPLKPKDVGLQHFQATEPHGNSATDADVKTEMNSLDNKTQTYEGQNTQTRRDQENDSVHHRLPTDETQSLRTERHGEQQKIEENIDTSDDFVDVKREDVPTFPEGSRTMPKLKSGTVVLSTVMRHGVVSYESEDVEIWEGDKKWRVSPQEARRLKEKWKSTRTAGLKLVTDDDGLVKITVEPETGIIQQRNNDNQVFRNDEEEAGSGRRPFSHGEGEGQKSELRSEAEEANYGATGSGAGWTSVPFPADTVLLDTRLRYGKISYQKEDVVDLKEGWQPSERRVSHLGEDYLSTPEARVRFISDGYGGVRYVVTRTAAAPDWKKCPSRLTRRECLIIFFMLMLCLMLLVFWALGLFNTKTTKKVSSFS